MRMTVSAAYVGIAVAVVAISYLIQRNTTINLSRQEPPLLKPRMPLIGHIVGLMKEEAVYFSTLRSRMKRPAITISMLNEKLYVLFSPHLAQQAMRQRNLDFDSVSLSFNKDVAGISDQAMSERVKKGPNTYTAEAMAGIKTGLMAPGLYRTNDALLGYVASQLNAIGAGDEGLHLPSMWFWMRDMMSMATMEALFGHDNPFRADPASLESLWGFDNGVSSMLFMPRALAGAGPQHRDRVVRTLRPFIDKRLDQNDDVSGFVALPTEASIKHNIVDDDLCKNLLMALWASTTNSIPVLFWIFTNVWQRPSLMESLRNEIFPFVTFSTENDKRKATLKIRQIEKQCPLLLSCQREGVRSTAHMVARREVTADTTLTDEDGTSYLLKKGSGVMWSAKVAHQLPEVWGADSFDFNPERFAKEPEDKETERKRRAAYMPFGGGMHLCPGRHLALDEILGLISALVLGFEVEGFRPEQTKIGKRGLANGIAKPAEGCDGGPVTLKRREGWEDVLWSFECCP